MSEFGRFEYESDAVDAFQDYLNETNPTVTVCGLDYDPARVLEEVDPIAFRTMFNDWLDEDMREWEEEQEDDDDASDVPFGERCRDDEGYVWERDGDKWTQPGMPSFVPRVTTEQLKAFGPFEAL